MPKKTIYIAQNPYHLQYHFGIEAEDTIRYTRDSWETEEQARENAEKRFGAPFGVTLHFVNKDWLVPLQNAKQI